MTSLETALRQVHADLLEAHAACALIGGLAVSARTEPRFTRDADLAVAVTNDLEAEKLIHELQRRGYSIEAVLEQKAVGRLATVRLTRTADLQWPVTDLLFASSGIEPEVVSAAEPLELVPELTIAVATAGHLIALKVLSRDDVSRPQDVADIRALLGIASAAELARAQEAVALITARGYNRGRDLPLELNKLLDPTFGRG